MFTNPAGSLKAWLIWVAYQKLNLKKTTNGQ